MAGSKEFTKMLTVSLCGYFYIIIVHIFQILCKENILFLEFKKIMFLKSPTLNPLNPNILSRKMCTHVFFSLGQKESRPQERPEFQQFPTPETSNTLDSLKQD